MKPEGHHKIANTVGIPLFRRILGDETKNLAAFYLGNWLSDNSQVVDPVLFFVLNQKSKNSKWPEESHKLLDDLAEDIVSSVFSRDHSIRDPEPIDGLEEIIALIKQKLREAMDYLTIPQTEDERSANLSEFFRGMTFIMGYFHFVADEEFNIPYEYYHNIFGGPPEVYGASRLGFASDSPGSFTQYYPHEHYDRPEVFPIKDPPQYVPGKKTERSVFYYLEPNKDNRTRALSRQEDLDPDIYSYLRDYIEMTAGLLAQVDMEFKEHLGQKTYEYDWSRTLAMLGHALHQVEDFFAHSNWVELAVQRLGDPLKDKVIPPEIGIEALDRFNTIVHKRLKRFMTNPGRLFPEKLSDQKNTDDYQQSQTHWEKLPDEKNVVTGYFDLRDILLSIIRMGEAFFGIDVKDPKVELHDAWEKMENVFDDPLAPINQVKKLIVDTLCCINEPESSLEDDDNQVAKIIREYLKPFITSDDKSVNDKKEQKITDKKIIEVIAEKVYNDSGLFKGKKQIPPLIKEIFILVIKRGSMPSNGSNTNTLFGSLHLLYRFLNDPKGRLKYILKAAKEINPARKVAKKAKDLVIFLCREKIYDLIGATRIGCHSLLAKDHSGSPLFGLSMNAGASVHWYIVKTLLRWKNDPSASFIDWTELLEHFLRNPSHQQWERVCITPAPITITYFTEKGDRLDTMEGVDPKYSITKKFLQYSSKSRPITWKSIADANFDTAELSEEQTKRVINQKLSKSGGIKVSKSNYAFKEGTPIRIPGINAFSFFQPVQKINLTWYAEVLMNGWEVITSPDESNKKHPLYGYKPIPIKDVALEQIILRGKDLRRIARDSYRPDLAGKSSQVPPMISK